MAALMPAAPLPAALTQPPKLDNGDPANLARLLRRRALQWLAQRELSTLEMQSRLARAAASAENVPEGTVEQVLQWLLDQGHLSPQRFVDSRIRTRQSRFGSQRILQELQQHGISLDAERLQQLQDSELERARQIWRRRFQQPARDTADQNRRVRFMIGRGFSLALVRQLIQEPDDQQLDEGQDARPAA